MSRHYEVGGRFLLGLAEAGVTDGQLERIARSSVLPDKVAEAINLLVEEDRQREIAEHAERQRILNASVAKIVSVTGVEIPEVEVIVRTLQVNDVKFIRDLVKKTRDDLRDMNFTSQNIVHVEAALRAVGIHLGEEPQG